MIHSIEQWMKGLFLLLIGISFLEILIPKGAVSSFVKYVFSVVILASILLPVANGFEQENLTTLGPIYTGEETSAQIQQQTDQLDRMQTKQIVEVYKEKIVSAVKESLIEEFPGISKLHIVVYIDENIKKKTFGQIQKILLQMPKQQQEAQIKAHVSNFLNLAESRIFTEEIKEDEV